MELKAERKLEGARQGEEGEKQSKIEVKIDYIFKKKWVQKMGTRIAYKSAKFSLALRLKTLKYISRQFSSQIFSLILLPFYKPVPFYILIMTPTPSISWVTKTIQINKSRMSKTAIK